MICATFIVKPLIDFILGCVQMIFNVNFLVGNSNGIKYDALKLSVLWWVYNCFKLL